MDRNSAIGFVLIALIVIGYIIYSTPSQQQIDKMNHERDSIAYVEKQKSIGDSLQRLGVKDSTHAPAIVSPGQAAAQKIFRDTSVSSEQNFTIENELMKVTLSSRGGKVVSVELKKYKTSNKEPLVLFNEANTR